MKQLSRAQKLRIADLYGKGVSSYTLAIKFKISPQTVIRISRRCGYTIRKQGRSQQIGYDERKRIVELFERGQKTGDIALNFNRSKSSIIRVLKMMGVNLSRKRKLIDSFNIEHGSVEQQLS